MDQQLNSDLQEVDAIPCPDNQTDQQSSAKNAQKWDKILNIALIVVIAVLICTVVIRAFFLSNVVIAGDSMDPTFVDEQAVTVSRIVNENNVTRGDVVVFYLKKPDWFTHRFNFFASPIDDKSTDQHRLLIKRIVALQGDKIWVEQVNDKYKIVIQTPDGQILEENNYLYEKEQLPQERFLVDANALHRLKNYTKQNPYTIPQGHFFAVGDNRRLSHDSRFSDIGDIPYANLFGVVI